MDSLPSLEDDGLVAPIVGEWGEEKYQLVGCYAQVFARSMKNRWEQRICIDLFSGSGRAQLKDSHRIVPASPLLALGITDPFDRYIFCDIDEANINALKSRVEREYPTRDVRYVQDDSNANVEQILTLIPPYSTECRVLNFCFVDPFNIKNLKFETIKQLAAGKRSIDFLVLIPSGMDAQRNTRHDNTLYADFLDNASWRDEWKREEQRRRGFGSFFVDQFGAAMERIGFRWEGVPSTRIIKNEKNSPIYHLAFFSRAPIAGRFWDDCKRSTRTQAKFPFM
jgi:three-Cys-motif partner protein